MHSFNEIKKIVGEEFDKLKFETEPKELYEPINYILGIGGKRIRPVAALLSCELFGGNIQKAMMPAIGMEVFHNFTLMHDDIMDNADKRRTHTTVHVKWNENTAILSGDAMLILANKLMMKADHDILPEVMELYNNTGLLVCEGQQFDMNYESRTSISINEYIQMINLKTAVLLAGCLKLGAVIARTSNNNKDLIEQFGLNLGISFQIEDDLLDTFGDFDSFGKNIGGDIESNKKTFLLVKAFELANDETKKTLMSLTGKNDLGKQEKFEQVKQIYEKLGLKEIALQESNNFFQKALKNLDTIEIEHENKLPLLELAKSLINRVF